MTGSDLRTILARAAAAPGEPPELDDLWARGRGRRRRTRGLAVAAAVVVLAGLAGGAIALGTGDDDEGVVAGPVTEPVGRPDGAPPAEPADGAVAITIDAGPPADGLATAEPGGTIVASFAVAGDGGFGRSAVATWERWDGARWEPEHVLQAELAGEPGSGAVLGVDQAVRGGQLRFEGEVDRYPTPNGLAAGWYRICVPMHQYSGVGPTVPGSEPPSVPYGPLPPRPDPAPVRPVAFGATIWPCAQLRVPDPDVPEEEVVDPTAPGDDPADAVAPSSTTAPTTTGGGAASPPPGWGEERPAAEVAAYTTGTPPHLAGQPVGVQIGRGGGITLGAETTWEQWDGTAWVRTHLVEGVTTGGERRLVPLSDGERPTVPDHAMVSERDLTELVVPVPPLGELTSPYSRVCFDAEPSGLGRPCAEVDVDGAGGRALTTHGDEATWVVDPARPPTIGASSFGVLVTRVGCNGGATGEVLRPQMTPGIHTITFTIDVAPVDGQATCPSNDAVPVTVELDGPLTAGPDGTRVVLDGHCRSECPAPPVRWVAES